MQEQLKYLVELQTIENKKAELIRSREKAPERLARLDKEFEAVESEYLLKKTEYEHVQELHRATEREIADLENRLRRSRLRRNEVKTNREYQAILKEIGDLEEEISSKEDQVLEFMETLETLAGEVEELRRNVAEKRNIYEQRKAAIQKDCDEVNDKIALLNARQEEIRSRLETSLLRQWDDLCRRRNGVAVAPVEKGVCQICHLNIPPQSFIELQRDESILHCPHCHRFIFWPGHEAYQCSVEDLDA